LEESFKMRNLLMEFGQNSDATRPCTIVGFREHIFTSGLTSLATFMGLQEGCFVTLSQRVLTSPLRMRLHYGHPDVFDKIFSLTRGGVSKASKGINLSEDIFAGFNHTLRGGRVAYAEYLQVGKGRDVGMHQIYKFEAKLSQGNGEQMISRDVSRLGERLDIARLLSFYYSGPGFYLNVALTIVCIYVFLYSLLWTTLFPIKSGPLPYLDILTLEWTLQLGLLLIIPTFCFLAVETGVASAVWEIVRTVLLGSPLFFMFHMGTKAHYVSSTLKYGGARYRPTGRGFVMRHENFAEIYRWVGGGHRLFSGRLGDLSFKSTGEHVSPLKHWLRQGRMA
ncbi:glycosyl transferase, partial [Pavlovales sp. CCMP2436]